MSLTILITDDEPHVIQVVGLKLRTEGYQVLEASFGTHALELAQAHIPDLIVTDFQMPAMTGLELATKLKTDPTTAHIPIIMITARGHKIAAEERALTNIQAMMPKPFSPRALLTLVNEILGDGTAQAA